MRPMPPAAMAADPTNTNGSSRYASCQAGTAVSLSSAAVYEATNGAQRAAENAPAVVRGLNRGVTTPMAANADEDPKPASNHEPTLIGEVGLKTRNMLKNRDGFPRSCTRATPDIAAPAVATSFERWASASKPRSCAPVASSDDPAASPPRNR